MTQLPSQGLCQYFTSSVSTVFPSLFLSMLVFSFVVDLSRVCLLLVLRQSVAVPLQFTFEPAGQPLFWPIAPMMVEVGWFPGAVDVCFLVRGFGLHVHLVRNHLMLLYRLCPPLVIDQFPGNGTK